MAEQIVSQDAEQAEPRSLHEMLGDPADPALVEKSIASLVGHAQGLIISLDHIALDEFSRKALEGALADLNAIFQKHLTLVPASALNTYEYVANWPFDRQVGTNVDKVA